MAVFFTLFSNLPFILLFAFMKTKLSFSLPAALLAAVPSALGAPAGTEMGNVMYVGDSITHGVNSASYRWALHKILRTMAFPITRKA